jgi:FkbH-like protein
MKILIVSDITFEPILKEINKSDNAFKISLGYFEDLNTSFYQVDINEYDVVFFHSDLFFHIREIEWQKQLLDNLYQFCKNNPLAQIIASNTFNLGFKSNGRQLIYSEVDTYNFELQNQINELLSQNNFCFFDYKKIVFELGFKNCFNYVLGAMYQMPYNKPFILSFSHEFLVFFNFLKFEEKKAIIVDCDNTLWNGVIGEDGIEGIKCDKNHEGIVFYNFQKFLKEKIKDGFILCICSKNNEEEVEDLFKSNKFPLKWDDFLIKKINWKEKSENIKTIANELNIGENSMIFIDDNPFELDSVLNLTDLKDGFLFKNSFENLFSIVNSYSFKRKKILMDDIEKNSKYKTEQIRKLDELKFENIDDYINSLNLDLTIYKNDLSSIDRISQMTEKTNQFNFNKKYFSVNEIRNWVECGNIIYSAKLVDKYGDYGIVGLIMFEKIVNSQFQLENFLMSCRSLGKKVEDKFYSDVENLMKINNNSIVSIKYKKTNKNIPADVFIKKLEKNGSIIKEIE